MAYKAHIADGNNQVLGAGRGRKLLGSEIEYTADSLRWMDHVTAPSNVQATIVNADSFAEEHSGSQSSVNFEQCVFRGSTAKPLNSIFDREERA